MFDSHSTSASSRLTEFQAVILCGHGEDLYPLTAGSGSNGLPKALLPVANKPLVEGVLKWIEQAGLIGALFDERLEGNEVTHISAGRCAATCS